MNGLDNDLIKYIVRESITGVVLVLVLWSYRRDWHRLFKESLSRGQQMQTLLERCIEALNKSSTINENLVDAVRELIRNANQTIPPRRFRRNRESPREISGE